MYLMLLNLLGPYVVVVASSMCKAALPAVGRNLVGIASSFISRGKQVRQKTQQTRKMEEFSHMDRRRAFCFTFPKHVYLLRLVLHFRLHFRKPRSETPAANLTKRNRLEALG